MKNAFLLTFLLILTLFVKAQKIHVVADERILQKLENKKLMNTPDAKHNGFRYQLFQGASRSAAFVANENFLSIFPDVPSYILYDPPNFKVRIGDFRFKYEALAFRDELRKQNIGTYFIVHDKINLPKPR